MICLHFSSRFRVFCVIVEIDLYRSKADMKTTMATNALLGPLSFRPRGNHAALVLEAFALYLNEFILLVVSAGSIHLNLGGTSSKPILPGGPSLQQIEPIFDGGQRLTCPCRIKRYFVLSLRTTNGLRVGCTKCSTTSITRRSFGFSTASYRLQLISL